jgi:hypothetical protein
MMIMLIVHRLTASMYVCLLFEDAQHPFLPFFRSLPSFIMTQICDDTNQAQGFAVIGIDSMVFNERMMDIACLLVINLRSPTNFILYLILILPFAILLASTLLSLECRHCVWSCSVRCTGIRCIPCSACSSGS